ncbi:unnamed protein product [Diatraea saccharalis]|uniref:Uncharacterized protein n=1 Tax=Diatraea saccharalis TaxID=40085 RepID=A0A9N9QY98_9NEOP|nr:unnamed protein product [Diatraea saccharalis]
MSILAYQEVNRRIDELTRVIYELDPYFVMPATASELDEPVRTLSMLVSTGDSARARRARSPQRRARSPAWLLAGTTYAEIVKGYGSRSSSFGSRQPSAQRPDSHRQPSAQREQSGSREFKEKDSPPKDVYTCASEKISVTVQSCVQCNPIEDMTFEPSGGYSESRECDSVSESERYRHECMNDYVDDYVTRNVPVMKETCGYYAPSSHEESSSENQTFKLPKPKSHTELENIPSSTLLELTPSERVTRTSSPAAKYRSQDLSYAEILALGLRKQVKTHSVATLPKPQVAQVELMKEIVVESTEIQPIQYTESVIDRRETLNTKRDNQERPSQRSRSRDMPRQRRAPEKRPSKAHDTQGTKKKKTVKKVIEVQDFDDSNETLQPVEIIPTALPTKIDSPKKELTKKIQHSATIVETVVENVGTMPQQSDKINIEVESKKSKKKHKAKKGKPAEDEIQKALKEIEESDKNKKKKPKESRDKSKEMEKHSVDEIVYPVGDKNKHMIDHKGDIKKEQQCAKQYTDVSSDTFAISTQETETINQPDIDNIKRDTLEMTTKYKESDNNLNATIPIKIPPKDSHPSKSKKKKSVNKLKCSEVAKDNVLSESLDAEPKTKKKKKNKNSDDIQNQKQMLFETADTIEIPISEDIKVIEPISQEVPTIVEQVEEFKPISKDIEPNQCFEESISAQDLVSSVDIDKQYRTSSVSENVNTQKKKKTKPKKNKIEDNEVEKALQEIEKLESHKKKSKERQGKAKHEKNKETTNLDTITFNKTVISCDEHIIEKDFDQKLDASIRLENVENKLVSVDWNDLIAEEENVNEPILIANENASFDLCKKVEQASEVIILKEDKKIISEEVSSVIDGTADSSFTINQSEPICRKLSIDTELTDIQQETSTISSLPSEQNNNDKYFSAEPLKDNSIRFIEEQSSFQDIPKEAETRTIYLITHEEKKLPPIRTVKVFSSKSNSLEDTSPIDENISFINDEKKSDKITDEKSSNINKKLDEPVGSNTHILADSNKNDIENFLENEKRLTEKALQEKLDDREPSLYLDLESQIKPHYEQHGDTMKAYNLQNIAEDINSPCTVIVAQDNVGELGALGISQETVTNENILEEAIFGSVQDRKKISSGTVSTIPYTQLVEESKKYSLEMDMNELEYNYYQFIIKSNKQKQPSNELSLEREKENQETMNDAFIKNNLLSQISLEITEPLLNEKKLGTTDVELRDAEQIFENMIVAHETQTYKDENVKNKDEDIKLQTEIPIIETKEVLETFQKIDHVCQENQESSEAKQSVVNLLIDEKNIIKHNHQDIKDGEIALAILAERKLKSEQQNTDNDHQQIIYSTDKSPDKFLSESCNQKINEYMQNLDLEHSTKQDLSHEQSKPEQEILRHSYREIQDAENILAMSSQRIKSKPNENVHETETHVNIKKNAVDDSTIGEIVEEIDIDRDIIRPGDRNYNKFDSRCLPAEDIDLKSCSTKSTNIEKIIPKEEALKYNYHEINDAEIIFANVISAPILLNLAAVQNTHNDLEEDDIQITVDHHPAIIQSFESTDNKTEDIQTALQTQISEMQTNKNIVDETIITQSAAEHSPIKVKNIENNDDHQSISTQVIDHILDEKIITQSRADEHCLSVNLNQTAVSECIAKEVESHNIDEINTNDGNSSNSYIIPTQEALRYDYQVINDAENKLAFSTKSNANTQISIAVKDENNDNTIQTQMTGNENMDMEVKISPLRQTYHEIIDAENVLSKVSIAHNENESVDETSYKKEDGLNETYEQDKIKESITFENTYHKYKYSELVDAETKLALVKSSGLYSELNTISDKTNNLPSTLNMNNSKTEEQCGTDSIDNKFSSSEQNMNQKSKYEEFESKQNNYEEIKEDKKSLETTSIDVSNLLTLDPHEGLLMKSEENLEISMETTRDHISEKCKPLQKNDSSENIDQYKDDVMEQMKSSGEIDYQIITDTAELKSDIISFNIMQEPKSFEVDLNKTPIVVKYGTEQDDKENIQRENIISTNVNNDIPNTSLENAPAQLDESFEPAIKLTEQCELLSDKKDTYNIECSREIATLINTTEGTETISLINTRTDEPDIKPDAISVEPTMNKIVIVDTKTLEPDTTDNILGGQCMEQLSEPKENIQHQKNMSNDVDLSLSKNETCTRTDKSPIHSLHDLLPEIDSIPEFKPSFSNTVLFSNLSADAPEFTPSYMYQHNAGSEIKETHDDVLRSGSKSADVTCSSILQDKEEPQEHNVKADDSNISEPVNKQANETIEMSEEVMIPVKSKKNKKKKKKEDKREETSILHDSQTSEVEIKPPVQEIINVWANIADEGKSYAEVVAEGLDHENIGKDSPLHTVGTSYMPDEENELRSKDEISEISEKYSATEESLGSWANIVAANRTSPDRVFQSETNLEPHAHEQTRAPVILIEELNSELHKPPITMDAEGFITVERHRRSRSRSRDNRAWSTSNITTKEERDKSENRFDALVTTLNTDNAEIIQTGHSDDEIENSMIKISKSRKSRSSKSKEKDIQSKVIEYEPTASVNEKQSIKKNKKKRGGKSVEKANTNDDTALIPDSELENKNIIIIDKKEIPVDVMKGDKKKNKKKNEKQRKIDIHSDECSHSTVGQNEKDPNFVSNALKQAIETPISTPECSQTPVKDRIFSEAQYWKVDPSHLDSLPSLSIKSETNDNEFQIESSSKANHQFKATSTEVSLKTNTVLENNERKETAEKATCTIQDQITKNEEKITEEQSLENKMADLQREIEEMLLPENDSSQTSDEVLPELISPISIEYDNEEISAFMTPSLASPDPEDKMLLDTKNLSETGRLHDMNDEQILRIEEDLDTKHVSVSMIDSVLQEPDFKIKERVDLPENLNQIEDLAIEDPKNDNPDQIISKLTATQMLMQPGESINDIVANVESNVVTNNIKNIKPENFFTEKHIINDAEKMLHRQNVIETNMNLSNTKLALETCSHKQVNLNQNLFIDHSFWLDKHVYNDAERQYYLAMSKKLRTSDLSPIDFEMKDNNDKDKDPSGSSGHCSDNDEPRDSSSTSFDSNYISMDLPGGICSWKDQSSYLSLETTGDITEAKAEDTLPTLTDTREDLLTTLSLEPVALSPSQQEPTEGDATTRTAKDDLSNDIESLLEEVRNVQTRLTDLPDESLNAMEDGLRDGIAVLVKCEEAANLLETKIMEYKQEEEIQILLKELIIMKARISKLLTQARQGLDIIQEVKVEMSRQTKEIEENKEKILKLDTWLESINNELKSSTIKGDILIEEDIIKYIEIYEKYINDYEEYEVILKSITVISSDESSQAMSEKLHVMQKALEETKNLVIIELERLRYVLLHMKSAPELIEDDVSQTDRTIDSTSMPEEIVTPREAEIVKEKEHSNLEEKLISCDIVDTEIPPVNIKEKIENITIETQTGKSLLSEPPSMTDKSVICEQGVKETHDVSVTCAPPQEVEIQTSEPHSIEHEREIFGSIQVRQTISDGHETIEIASKPITKEQKADEHSLFVDANYKDDKSHKDSQLNIIHSLPQSFETVMVEPDETTTEVVVDADGTKRIIVKKIRKTLVTRQQTLHTQQQRSQILSSEDLPQETFSQVTLREDKGAISTTSGDGRIQHIHYQSHDGQIISGLPGGEVTIQEFTSKPDMVITMEEDMKPEDILQLAEGQTLPQIQTSSSSVTAVVQQVTKRIVKTRRRIIRRVVIIDGKEHVTEEVIEEPDNIEMFEEQIPRISINVTDQGGVQFEEIEGSDDKGDHPPLPPSHPKPDDTSPDDNNFDGKNDSKYIKDASDYTVIHQETESQKLAKDIGESVSEKLQEGPYKIITEESESFKTIPLSKTIAETTESPFDNNITSVQTGQFITTEQASNMSTIVQKVTRKITRTRKRIIKHIQIVDGKEHVTEEVIEEPEDVEIIEEEPNVIHNLQKQGFRTKKIRVIRQIQIIDGKEHVTEKVIEEPDDDVEQTIDDIGKIMTSEIDLNIENLPDSSKDNENVKSEVKETNFTQGPSRLVKSVTLQKMTENKTHEMEGKQIEIRNPVLEENETQRHQDKYVEITEVTSPIDASKCLIGKEIEHSTKQEPVIDQEKNQEKFLVPSKQSSPENTLGVITSAISTFTTVSPSNLSNKEESVITEAEIPYIQTESLMEKDSIENKPIENIVGSSQKTDIVKLHHRTPDKKVTEVKEKQSQHNNPVLKENEDHDTMSHLVHETLSKQEKHAEEIEISPPVTVSKSFIESEIEHSAKLKPVIEQDNNIPEIKFVVPPEQLSAETTISLTPISPTPTISALAASLNKNENVTTEVEVPHCMQTTVLISKDSIVNKSIENTGDCPQNSNVTERFSTIPEKDVTKVIEKQPNVSSVLKSEVHESMNLPKEEKFNENTEVSSPIVASQSFMGCEIEHSSKLKYAIGQDKNFNKEENEDNTKETTEKKLSETAKDFKTVQPNDMPQTPIFEDTNKDVNVVVEKDAKIPEKEIISHNIMEAEDQDELTKVLQDTQNTYTSSKTSSTPIKPSDTRDKKELIQTIDKHYVNMLLESERQHTEGNISITEPLMSNTKQSEQSLEISTSINKTNVLLQPEPKVKVDVEIPKLERQASNITEKEVEVVLPTDIKDEFNKSNVQDIVRESPLLSEKNIESVEKIDTGVMSTKPQIIHKDPESPISEIILIKPQSLDENAEQFEKISNLDINLQITSTPQTIDPLTDSENDNDKIQPQTYYNQTELFVNQYPVQVEPFNQEIKVIESNVASDSKIPETSYVGQVQPSSDGEEPPFESTDNLGKSGSAKNYDVNLLLESERQHTDKYTNTKSEDNKEQIDNTNLINMETQKQSEQSMDISTCIIKSNKELKPEPKVKFDVKIENMESNKPLIIKKDIEVILPSDVKVSDEYKVLDVLNKIEKDETPVGTMSPQLDSLNSSSNQVKYILSEKPDIVEKTDFSSQIEIFEPDTSQVKDDLQLSQQSLELSMSLTKIDSTRKTEPKLKFDVKIEDTQSDVPTIVNKNIEVALPSEVEITMKETEYAVDPSEKIVSEISSDESKKGRKRSKNKTEAKQVSENDSIEIPTEKSFSETDSSSLDHYIQLPSSPVIDSPKPSENVFDTAVVLQVESGSPLDEFETVVEEIGYEPEEVSMEPIQTPNKKKKQKKHKQRGISEITTYPKLNTTDSDQTSVSTPIEFTESLPEKKTKDKKRKKKTVIDSKPELVQNIEQISETVQETQTKANSPKLGSETIDTSPREESYHTLSETSDISTVKIIEECIQSSPEILQNEITTTITYPITIVEEIPTQDYSIQTSPELSVETKVEENVEFKPATVDITQQTSPTPVSESLIQTIPKDEKEVHTQTLENVKVIERVELSETEMQTSRVETPEPIILTESTTQVVPSDIVTPEEKYSQTIPCEKDKDQTIEKVITETESREMQTSPLPEVQKDEKSTEVTITTAETDIQTMQQENIDKETSTSPIKEKEMNEMSVQTPEVPLTSTFTQSDEPEKQSVMLEAKLDFVPEPDIPKREILTSDISLQTSPREEILDQQKSFEPAFEKITSDISQQTSPRIALEYAKILIDKKDESHILETNIKDLLPKTDIESSHSVSELDEIIPGFNLEIDESITVDKTQQTTPRIEDNIIIQELIKENIITVHSTQQTSPRLYSEDSISTSTEEPYEVHLHAQISIPRATSDFIECERLNEDQPVIGEKQKQKKRKHKKKADLTQAQTPESPSDPITTELSMSVTPTSEDFSIKDSSSIDEGIYQFTSPITPNQDSTTLIQYKPTYSDVVQRSKSKSPSPSKSLSSLKNIKGRLLDTLEKRTQLISEPQRNASDNAMIVALYEPTVEKSYDMVVNKELDEVKSAIESKDSSRIEKSIIIVIETISVWLEEIQFKIQRETIAGNKNLEESERLRTLENHISNLKETIELTEVNEEIITLIETLTHQINAVNTLSKQSPLKIKEQETEWNKFIKDIETLSQCIDRVKCDLDNLILSDVPSQQKLEKLDKIELENTDNSDNVSKLLRRCRMFVEVNPKRECPVVLYSCHDDTKQIENAVNTERDRLMQLTSLAEEYEQTLQDFAQITEVAEALLDGKIVVSNLDHLHEEIQKHRKFFVNLSHCRAILESLEDNLDNETRGKYSALHNSLHDRATLIIDRAAGRAQQMTLGASRWTLLKQGMKEEKQWLVVAQQRVPDLSNVTSMDHEQYINLYQSISLDISHHYAKMLRLLSITEGLQNFIVCSDLETECSAALDTLVRLQEDVDSRLTRLTAFKENWMTFDHLIDRIEGRMQTANRELENITPETITTTGNLRRFWELKAQHEVYNNLKNESGIQFEKALEILPISDEMVQRQFFSKIEDKWQDLATRIGDIHKTAIQNLTDRDVSSSEKLNIIEEELRELRASLDCLKGVIRSEDELNLYIERLQVMTSRIDRILNELGRLSLLPTAESERLGALLTQSGILDDQISAELERSLLLKEKLVQVQTGIIRCQKSQRRDRLTLEECEAAERLGSDVVERASETCDRLMEDLSSQWRDILALRQSLHMLPTSLRVCVSPTGLEKDITALQDTHAELEAACNDLSLRLRAKVQLWKRFERQLEMVQGAVREADYMVELLTVQGQVDYDRLLKATEKLEVKSQLLNLIKIHLFNELLGVRWHSG